MRRWIASAAFVFLAGCAGPSLLLLPDEGGGQGAVAVLESRGQAQDAVVAQGNSRTSLRSRRPITRTGAAARLRANERALLADLPLPPARFELYFEEGSTRLTPASRSLLPSLYAEVASRPGVDIQVSGHTDRVGTEDDNDRLSQQRAEEIAAFLEANGIMRELMIAVGRGEREPRISTPDEVAEPKNRRVEIIVR